jgi:hypothetical protein
LLYENNIKKQKELIEKIGVIYEKAGHTPIAGRVAGLLFLSEPPYKSFEQIVLEHQPVKVLSVTPLTFF